MSDNTKTISSALNQTVSSLRASVENHPEYWPDLVKKYGWDLYEPDIMAMAGKTINIPSRTLKVLSQESYYRTVKLRSNIGAQLTPGGNITVILADTEYNSLGDCYLNVGDTILIPQAAVYLPYVYRVVAKAGGGAPTDGWTCTPLDSTATVTATSVLAGQELTVGAKLYAPGTGAGEGRNTPKFETSFGTSLIKTAITMEGGQIDQNKWAQFLNNDGSVGIWNEALKYAENNHTRDMETQYFLGQSNSNSITQTAAYNSGVSQVILSADGIMRPIIASGGEVKWDTEFGFEKFADIADYMIANRINNGVVDMKVGIDLYRAIERSGLEFVSQYSGGTDFTRIVGSIYGGSDAVALSTGFKMISKDGMTVHINPMRCFNDPTHLGASNGAGGYTYPFRSSALVCPVMKQQVNIGDSQELQTLDNLAIGYLAGNGSNRKFVNATLNGLTGAPGVPVHEFDYMRHVIMSEFFSIIINPHQFMLVKPA